jgi:hypothetical protein
MKYALLSIVFYSFFFLQRERSRLCCQNEEEIAAYVAKIN